MNKCVIEVTKIRSYQVLLYKNGYRSFPKPIYKTYKKELHTGMKNLKPLEKDVPIRLTLKFNVREGVSEPKWVVKLKTTGNTSKIFDNKEDALEYLKESKHYIEKRDLDIKYGSMGDVDNISKPVIDYLEELEIISNDRYVVDFHVTKTFNNSSESIEVTLEKLEINDNGIISFTKNK